MKYVAKTRMVGGQVLITWTIAFVFKLNKIYWQFENVKTLNRNSAVVCEPTISKQNPKADDALLTTSFF